MNNFILSKKIRLTRFCRRYLLQYNNMYIPLVVTCLYYIHHNCLFYGREAMCACIQYA